MSRRSGQRHNVRDNVATLQRGLRKTSQRSVQRCDAPENGTKQRRDVPETYKNPLCDVDISRRDVAERFKINVATLRTHVATFQRV